MLRAVRTDYAARLVGGGSMTCEGAHEFGPASKDPRRSCVRCGRPGRDNVGESGGFFGEATMARAEFFGGLNFPKSANGGKAK